MQTDNNKANKVTLLILLSESLLKRSEKRIDFHKILKGFTKKKLEVKNYLIETNEMSL